MIAALRRRINPKRFFIVTAGDFNKTEAAAGQSTVTRAEPNSNGPDPHDPRRGEQSGPALGAVGGEPLFIERGEGAFLVDVDGNRLLDYVGSWGPLILGHCHPEVVAAVEGGAGERTSLPPRPRPKPNWPN